MNRFLGALALAILCPIFIFAQHTEVTLEDNQTSLGITGNKTFSGLTNIINLNGVQKCDQFAGATIDVQLNACIAAAATNLVGAVGIADATGLRSGTIAAQVNVGNAANTQHVTLLLPDYATWLVSITDGTSCGIMLYNYGAIIGMGAATSGATLRIDSASSSTNVSALVCTDPSPIYGSSYVRAESFSLSNFNLGRMANAELLLQHLYDGTSFRNILVFGNGVVSSGSGIAMEVIGACCATHLESIVVNCNSIATCQPLTIGGTTDATHVDSLSCIDCSIDHPGIGLNNIIIGAFAANENINFYNLYMEPNCTKPPTCTTGDTSTPAVEIGANANNINFYGAMLPTVNSNPTAYMVDIANWAGPANDTFIGMKSQTKNVINDHVAGLTVAGDSTYGANALYISGSPTFGGALSATLFSANKGTAQTVGNITLPAGWGTGAAVALAGPSSQYTQLNEFTITSGSGSFAAAPTVQVVFPTAFPTAPVCSLNVGAITGSGGAILFKQTATLTTQTTFTATTSTGSAFTPAASETYTVVMHCGL